MPTPARAVCQQFGTEGDIFAVIGGRDFTQGAECLATRFQIPVIDTNQAPASLMAQTAPYMFTLKPDETELRDDVRQLGEPDRRARRQERRPLLGVAGLRCRGRLQVDPLRAPA